MHYKNLLKILLSILFFLFSIYLIYNIYSKNRPREILIIQAEHEETKIRPLERGGIVIPHADNIIYENLATQHTFRKITLLPEPEQALKIGAQKNISDGINNSIDEMLANILTPGQNDEIFNKESVELGDNIFEEDLVIFTPAQAEDIPASLPQSNKALNIIKVTEKSTKVNKSKTPALEASRNYKIQLATIKSESQGLLEGERIKRKHPKALGTSHISLKKVQHENGQFFYLILAGDYPNLSRAKATCKKLSACQQSCMIFKP